MDSVSPDSISHRINMALQHVADGGRSASRAAQPNLPAWERFQHGVRAMDGFEHAIRDVEGIPGAERVLGPALRGYELAKRGTEALLATGAIPEAQSHYGIAELTEARDHFTRARALVSGDRSEIPRSSWRQASDWISHAIDDAATGAAVLGKVRTGAELAAGLTAFRAATAVRRQLPESFLDRIDRSFDGALEELGSRIMAAGAAEPAPTR